MSESAARTKVPEIEPPKPKLDEWDLLVKRIEPGMVVLWYEGGYRQGMTPRPATVIETGGRTLCLWIMDREAPKGIYKVDSGIKHLDDPTAHAFERAEQGCWELTPFLKKWFSLIDQL